MKGIKLRELTILLGILGLTQGLNYCYECSSKSALCRYSVYDGQYLTKIPCASKCFLRTEGETTFRGCFDGWLGGMVDHQYVGCRMQEYLGEKVEWCFCEGDKDRDKQPCNGASQKALAKMALPHVTSDQDDQNEAYTKYFVPTVIPKSTPDLHESNNIAYELRFEDPAKPVLPSTTTAPYQSTARMCKELTDGTYADPKDCTRYYHCSNGLPYHMHCGAGTIWNDQLKGCTFTYNPYDPCHLPGSFKTLALSDDQNDVIGDPFNGYYYTGATFFNKRNKYNSGKSPND